MKQCFESAHYYLQNINYFYYLKSDVTYFKVTYMMQLTSIKMCKARMFSFVQVYFVKCISYTPVVSVLLQIKVFLLGIYNRCIMNVTIICLFYGFIFHSCSELFCCELKDLLWSEGNKNMFKWFMFVLFTSVLYIF